MNKTVLRKATAPTVTLDYAIDRGSTAFIFLGHTHDFYVAVKRFRVKLPSKRKKKIKKFLQKIKKN